MSSDIYRLYSRGLSWLLLGFVAAYAALVTWLDLPLLAYRIDWFLLLAPMAAFAAWMVTAPGSSSTGLRMSLTWVLAAAALLPAPAAILVAAAAGIAGRAGGVAGPHRRSVPCLAALLLAVVVAQFFAGSLGWPADPASWATLARLAMLYVIIQGFSYALALALDPDIGDALLGPEGPSWKTTVLEMANVPLAWLLASLAGFDSWLGALTLSVLVLAALALLQRLDVLLRQVADTNDALGSRLTELATLHSIGREILSSMDPSRIYTLLERECRKIFDVDVCLIALVDRDTSRLELAYRRRRGERQEPTGSLLESGIAAWVLEHRRARRVDDTTQAPDAAEPGARSLMAVPLLVEERAIGVLCVQSRRPAAYDDHQLSVLTTIAQQAAVAIENARHYQMATVDSLTGFFLRDYFFRRLDEEYKRVRRYGGSFGLLMVDLDDFKEINDAHGHLAGDQYLHEISATIRGQLRAADLACRYGGDEFCLLLPETDLHGARTIAERIRSAVARRSVALDGRALRTTVSIGVAAVPEHDGGDLRELMRNADEALYRAKRAGRDCVVPFAA